MQLETLKKCDICESDKIIRLDSKNNICRCGACGYIFDNPRPATEEIIKFYSQPSQYGFWFEEARDLLCQRRLKMIQKHKKQGKLLDIGAGPGQFLNQAKVFFDVDGTEISKTAVRLAKEKYNIDLIEGEFEKIDFKDSKFDAITIIHTLEHVPSPSSIVKKCRTLLKEDGVLIIAVPNDIQSFKAWARILLSIFKVSRWKNRGIFGFPRITLDGAMSEIHVSHFTSAVLKTLLIKQGFIVIEDTLDPGYLLKEYKRIFYDILYLCCMIFKKITGRNYFSSIWMVAKIQKAPEACPICRQGKRFKFIKDFSKEQTRYSLYQCLECQVQFWLPLESIIKEWQEDVDQNKVRRLLNSEMNREYHQLFLKRNKSFLKYTKVLDLGCGAGEFILKLEKIGCEAFGIDFDEGAIKIAKNNFGLKNVFSMSFDDFFNRTDVGKFDIITFFEVLEHLEAPADFMNKIKKFLKPGGKIVFSTPSRERFFVNANKWDFPPHHLTRWDKESIENIFSKYGFKVDFVDYVEVFKIIMGAVDGKLRSGLVQKTLNAGNLGKKRIFFSKILYLSAKAKQWILAGIPAVILWFFGKIIKRNNGIIYVELSLK